MLLDMGTALAALGIIAVALENWTLAAVALGAAVWLVS
jgi:hypothetical protein